MAAEFLTEGTTMSSVARWYIALVVASGTVILLLAARWWSSASLTQFAALLCFTLFASTLKVRIPGMTSTISPNFAFLLIAIAFFSFSQVIVATVGAALMQSFWRPKSRPQMVQVLFSAAALVLSSAFAFTAAHLVVRPFDNNSVAEFASGCASDGSCLPILSGPIQEAGRMQSGQRRGRGTACHFVPGTLTVQVYCFPSSSSRSAGAVCKDENSVWIVRGQDSKS